MSSKRVASIQLKPVIFDPAQLLQLYGFSQVVVDGWHTPVLAEFGVPSFSILRSRASVAPASVSALSIFQQHWPNYCREAAGLAGFVLCAGGLATLLEYPGSPVNQAIGSPSLRHLALGAAMAVFVTTLVYSPWGKRTGAHINPAVTWSFYRLGRIGGWDALFYTIFQFAGALLAPLLLLWVIGAPFGHERIRYGTTQPGLPGEWVALAAEFAISFVMMLVLLFALGSQRWAKRSGLLIAALIGLYIAVETPLSGMSLNPARSFGAALLAGQWHGIWLYFAAPPLAMLLATELYRRARPASIISLPHYPVPVEKPS